MSTHSPIHRVKSLASNIDIFLGQAITACFVGDAIFDIRFSSLLFCKRSMGACGSFLVTNG